MDIDPRICSQARLSRDARFDEDSYRRPDHAHLLPSDLSVRAAKERTLVIFDRSRRRRRRISSVLTLPPELSPGTPAWLGTTSTVSRALRLISENALEDRSVDELAARLGVGSRQLSRLFLRHLGATPVTVAKTRRLHFAKKLIDETSLPMGQIALAAGLGACGDSTPHSAGPTRERQPRYDGWRMPLPAT